MLKRVLLILLAFIVGANAGPASAQNPTTTEKVLNQWLAAFNSDDRAKLLAFWRVYGSDAPDTKVGRDHDLHEMTGGFTVVKILEDTGSHLVVSMKDGHSGYAEITLDLVSTDPPVIKSIVGHPVPPPQSERVPVANDQDLAAQVSAHAGDMLLKDEFTGAILIARQGQPVLNRAWGLADREKKIQNSVDTQFCLGSMNKMFTAVSVLQLVQAGKLSLDGFVVDYWPDYPNHDLATKVTIRQLLNHTAGTGDIFTPEYEAHRTEIRTLDDYVKLFGHRALAFEPGLKFEYSNYGFILLGRLIEIVSGEEYQSYALPAPVAIPAGCGSHYVL
jgi:hypothetical protein